MEGHPLVIERYPGVKDIRDCQILFISSSESKRIKTILASLKGRSILTVGDFESFIKDGGIIRFFEKKNKIHLRVDPEAAKLARLSISSKILRLAEIVEQGKY